MTILRVVQGDITKLAVDAIVNAANSSLLGGGGVDGAIHRAGGPAILAECQAIGGCATGDAVVTTAGNLPARFVIHAVGPVWDPAYEDAVSIELASCYKTSLRLAAERGCKTIAFPNISTGIYRFPRPKAASIAIGAVREAAGADPRLDAVTFVCFDDDNLAIYRELLG